MAQSFTQRTKDAIKSHIQELQDVLSSLEDSEDENDLWIALEDLCNAHCDNFKATVTKIYKEYNGE